LIAGDSSIYTTTLGNVCSIESLYITVTGDNLAALRIIEKMEPNFPGTGQSSSSVARILWLNWRDLANPDGGGAEVFTHEVMQRLVKRGHKVTLFTSQFSNAPLNEKMDSVDIVRRGHKYKVYREARDYYKKHKNDFDIVIDEINIKPFLTPKFIRKEKPVIALIFQLAKELFLIELPFPLNYIGYNMETRWLSHYKDVPTLTISDSTKRDLEHLGFRDISVVPVGISSTPLDRVPEKEHIPTIVFIGRLKKHKRPHHAIRAFSLIKKRIPNARLWIIGDGYMRNELEGRRSLEGVTFFGRVSSQVKYQLLGKAHIVLVPSTREGWGLIVTEANSVGTPVVAYNVPGIRDSIIDGKTGILVKNGSPEDLAQTVISLFEDKDLLSTLSGNALNLSRQFSWENTADVFEKIIMQKIMVGIDRTA
jgi:glycosyltransferase involved in cell wall biosynthesis